LLAAGALLVAGCGSSKQFANQPKPATPVNLTVYINNARVSLSPASVGAGQVTLIVTNQASSSQTLQITPAGASDPLATTGPINPQGTAQVDVDLATQGTYVLSTGTAGETDAQLSGRAAIRPATLRVGAPRPNARNQLLVP
jgi:hypothetical protein